MLYEVLDSDRLIVEQDILSAHRERRSRPDGRGYWIAVVRLRNETLEIAWPPRVAVTPAELEETL